MSAVVSVRNDKSENFVRIFKHSIVYSPYPLQQIFLWTLDQRFTDRALFLSLFFALTAPLS